MDAGAVGQTNRGASTQLLTKKVWLSALGHYPTSPGGFGTTALHPKADMLSLGIEVGYVPIAALQSNSKFSGHLGRIPTVSVRLSTKSQRFGG